MNEGKALLKNEPLFQEVRDLEGWQAVAYAASYGKNAANYTLFCEVTEFADP